MLETLLTRFPAAVAFAPSFASERGDHRPDWLARTAVVRWRGRRRHFLAPVYARRVARRPLEGAKVVLSVPHAGWSLAAAVPPGARHLCYSAGVPRALYEHAEEYLQDYPPLVRPALRAALPALRAHNRRLVDRPHRILVNSAYSAARLSAHGIEAEVVHPPVRTSFFRPAPDVSKTHALTVSRLVSHKRLDAIVEAFRGLDETLVFAGTGPWESRLRAGAPPNVRFVGRVDDVQLRELYQSATCFVSAAPEEFGIAMAEAQASGIPVVAPRDGGALEIVRDGDTGMLLDDVGPRSLAQAVKAVRRRAYDPGACRAAVERFAEESFLQRFELILAEELSLAVDRQPRRASPRSARPDPQPEAAAPH